MDNDRYTFPAIFQLLQKNTGLCDDGGHLHEQESKAPLKLAGLQTRVRQRHNRPVRHENLRRPRDLGLGGGAEALVVHGIKSRTRGVDDEETLRKLLLISDAFDEL